MDPQRIRQTLESRRDELRGRERRVSADLRHEREPLTPDFADQAIQRSNDEVLEGIRDSANSELSQIERALTRLSAGRYGRCEHCGAEIASQRLVAVPYAERCASCAA
jgi:DnaK suppressor protein